MQNFSEFKMKVDEQFESMKTYALFMTDVSKENLWDTYLGSFLPGTNEIYKTRTEHDCECCKSFIRTCGNMVGIRDNKLISIWDIDVGGRYQPVANALAKLVKSAKIISPFYHFEDQLGADNDIQFLEDGKHIYWDHFFLKLPKRFVLQSNSIGTQISNDISNKNVFERSLKEFSTEAINTALDLINQNSIYRGAEHKKVVELFLKCKNEYDLIEISDKDNYCWQVSKKLKSIAKFRNTVIGTLISDISTGVSLDNAVQMFESKVAPTNYKRSSAIITKDMVRKAEKQIKKLGIESALHRRFAVQSDISVNNILFTNNPSYQSENIFDQLVEDTPEKFKNLNNVENVSIQTFIKDILPKAEEIKIFFENRHEKNLMSLITSETPNTSNIFKWNNNFSWTYNGDVTDSIKAKVKKAGGNVDAILRCSLAWYNYDDLDLHIKEPEGGHHIFFDNRKNTKTTGYLDVDMNVTPNGPKTSRNAVENIAWTDKNRMIEGIYEIFVVNYTLREHIDTGFEIELSYEGKSTFFNYNRKVKEKVKVANFEFTRKNGIRFLSTLPSISKDKDIWNIPTGSFHKVNMIMNSPNHWGEATGNKHYFFILNKCKTDKQVRGFFNEFLKEDLLEHRKVFEVLGSKMSVKESSKQLSGLGFSSTQKNSILCVVRGDFSRTIKINF